MTSRVQRISKSLAEHTKKTGANPMTSKFTIPKPNEDHIAWPGADVKITIFCDFRQFLAIKLAFFAKTNVMIKILYNLALF
jgi:hypothetical protein